MTNEEAMKCVDMTVNRLLTLPSAIFGESPNNVIYFAITVLLKKLADVRWSFSVPPGLSLDQRNARILFAKAQVQI